MLDHSTPDYGIGWFPRLIQGLEAVNLDHQYPSNPIQKSIEGNPRGIFFKACKSTDLYKLQK